MDLSKKISMNVVFVSVAMAVAIGFTSCAGAKVTSQNTAYYIQKHTNGVLAILPPKVQFDRRMLKSNATAESEDYQKVMYDFLLKYMASGYLLVDLQDIAETNAKLQEIGYSSARNNAITPQELAAALNVDAVLVSSYSLTKPYSRVIDVLFLPGFGNSFSFTTRTESFLYDGETGKLFWSAIYKKELTAIGGRGKTSLNLKPWMPLLITLGKYHKKFPYIKRK
jgi:hypothetical protein